MTRSFAHQQLTKALNVPQMTGGAQNVIYGQCDPLSFHPDLDWLDDTLSQPDPPKMVVRAKNSCKASRALERGNQSVVC